MLAFAWKNTASIALLHRLRTLKSLHSIEKTQPRICVTYNGNPCTTIFFCYNFTNVCDRSDIITFYNKLQSLVRHILKHNVPIIGEDINTLIGKCINKLFTKFPNRNDEYQVEFSFENWLVCLIMKFIKWNKNHRHLPTQITQAKLDYIFIDKGNIFS